jgi:hypothetical protein
MERDSGNRWFYINRFVEIENKIDVLSMFDS